MFFGQHLGIGDDTTAPQRTFLIQIVLCICSNHETARAPVASAPYGVLAEVHGDVLLRQANGCIKTQRIK